MTITKKKLFEELAHLGDDAEILISVAIQDIGAALASLQPEGEWLQLSQFVEFSVGGVVHTQPQDQHFLTALPKASKAS